MSCRLLMVLAVLLVVQVSLTLASPWGSGVRVVHSGYVARPVVYRGGFDHDDGFDSNEFDDHRYRSW